MYERLEDTELSIVDYVAQDQGIAYSNLKESRDKEELSSQTVSRDLRYSTQTQANIIIVAGSPGCNTAIEIFCFKQVFQKGNMVRKRSNFNTASL